MRNIIVSSLLVIFVLVSRPAFAYDKQVCTDDVLSVISHALGMAAQPAGEDKAFSFVSTACRADPDQPGLVQTAVAYPSPDSKESKMLLIAVIDTEHQKMLEKYSTSVEEDALTEFGESSLHIDTGRYGLVKGGSAFGVRFESVARGPSCADGVLFDNQLTLFVSAQGKLMPVLSLFMDVVQDIQGCLGSSTGQNVWESAELSIAAKKSRHHGYTDLKLVAHIKPGTEMDSPPKGIVMKERVESRTLRFDGKDYNTPEFAWWIQQ